MRISFDVADVTITVQQLAQLCVDANRDYYTIVQSAHNVVRNTGPSYLDPIAIETAIKYAYVAGVEHGMNQRGVK